MSSHCQQNLGFLLPWTPCGNPQVSALDQSHEPWSSQSSSRRFKAVPSAQDKRRCPIPMMAEKSPRSSSASSPSSKFTSTSLPFRPKQSLGQNFLVDPNMISQIVGTFADLVHEHEIDEADSKGRRVVEVGPGFAALSHLLVEHFPDMLAVELDQRAVAHLNENLPGLNVIRQDVLDVDWRELADQRQGTLRVIGNLPYYIVSQIIFSLIEQNESIDFAFLMMQKEVAQRIVAKTRSKDYGILSVMCQLYTKPKIAIHVPNTVFRPKPDVTSAMLYFKFEPNPRIGEVHSRHLREVVRASFQQRRKQLRNSLKKLVDDRVEQGFDAALGDFSSKRPEELEPEEFLDLTKMIFGAQTKDDTSGIQGVWRTKKAKKVEVPTDIGSEMEPEADQ